MPPSGHQGPAPHVNPAFFQQQHPAPQSNDMYNRMNNAPGQYGDYNRHMGGGDTTMGAPQISDIEFEEIMNKNRSISSGAISRAVADASAGTKVLKICVCKLSRFIMFKVTTLWRSKHFTRLLP